MDIEIKPSATLSSNPGSGLSRNIGPKRARPNDAQAKGDNEGFKREIQVMNNVRMPSSFIKENGDIIKRMKRKAHYMPAQPKPQQSAQKAPKKEAKQEEVSPVPLIIGISITAFIVMFIFVCFELPHDNVGQASAGSKTKIGLSTNLKQDQERAKHNVNEVVKANNDVFKKEIHQQIPMNMHKQPSVNNENDGLIKRIKRKAKAKPKAQKKKNSSGRVQPSVYSRSMSISYRHGLGKVEGLMKHKTGLLAFSSALILHHHDYNGNSLLNESRNGLGNGVDPNKTRLRRRRNIVGQLDLDLDLPLSDLSHPRFKSAKNNGGKHLKGSKPDFTKNKYVKSKNDTAVAKMVEIKGNTDGLKNEIQVPINIHKQPSVNNVNDSLIKRIKRTNQPTIIYGKREKRKKKPRIEDAQVMLKRQEKAKADAEKKKKEDESTQATIKMALMGVIGVVSFILVIVCVRLRRNVGVQLALELPPSDKSHSRYKRVPAKSKTKKPVDEVKIHKKEKQIKRAKPVLSIKREVEIKTKSKNDTALNQVVKSEGEIGVSFTTILIIVVIIVCCCRSKSDRTIKEIEKEKENQRKEKQKKDKENKHKEKKEKKKKKKDETNVKPIQTFNTNRMGQNMGQMGQMGHMQQMSQLLQLQQMGSGKMDMEAIRKMEEELIGLQNAEIIAEKRRKILMNNMMMSSYQ
ncbi:hypothetical protein LOTGIDRAFT_232547 [Lottia gigantea]|uniref:Uncharacterized protein n=1 Tax=Lottia gigantea TaxID=225164 RepID=V4AGM6_LOTGI|nr:hypothetical protein LOTGIDRAFT_232547 [Lottia gigantea]ESO94315.1 hypothetical protein LOTGIDRAFT_232547 [Lottia gigantea]